MVKPPVNTILLVGSPSTGKTAYVQRLMGIGFDEIVATRRSESHNRRVPRERNDNSISLHYIPIPDTDDVVRIIEMAGVIPIPQEYIGLIRKMVVFAAFDNEYSIHDITFHTNTYAYLNVPVHVIINKKDLLENASTDVHNAALVAGGVITAGGSAFASTHIISCKTDENVLPLPV